MKVKAIVKVSTEFGKWCLAEIRGLKEGTILEGVFNYRNKAFDFTYNGEDAMLWIGQNGELIRDSSGRIGYVVTVDAYFDGRYYGEFQTLEDAENTARENGIKQTEYWYHASEIINENGDLNIGCWDRDKKGAIDKLTALVK